MSEVVHAYSFVHEGHYTELEYLNFTPLVAGGVEKKAVIEASVGSAVVSLVERPYDEAYIAAWKAFRSVGLPVVPTLRSVSRSSRKSLLVTDVKADGSEVYGQGLSVVLEKNGAVRERPRPDVDPIFVELTHPKRITEVAARARAYASIADENRLRVPFDDPFELLVRPTGEWEMIMLDIRHGWKLDQRSHPAGLSESKEYNARNIQDFLSHLRNIRNNLMEQALPGKLRWWRRR